MPNDAKLGLVVGVGLVVAVAVTFFHKDPGGAQAIVPFTPALAARTKTADPRPSASVSRPVRGQYAGRLQEASTARRHLVKEGETLSTIAERYLGDREKSTEISRINQEVLQGKEDLTPGTILAIPDLPKSSVSAEENPSP
jgi:nucleoid-associated protein YgaU